MFGQLMSKLKDSNIIAHTRQLSTFMNPSRIMGSLKENSLWARVTKSPLLQRTEAMLLYDRTVIRTNVRVHYRPNALKRMRKHGLEKRLSSQSQREILCRRFIAGSRSLCVFDRFMNDLPERKIKGKRLCLFDAEKGYKSVIKKPEYFKFN